ncbi:MAG: DUF58 domain-containing protein [Endozoicomonadaceae bacterium]|nr:DUF58 domain-containing protein [Endozoicomonadaceae bacterium]
MSGAYTSLEELAQLHISARRLPCLQQGAARVQQGGGHLSRLRGRGMDFDEFRSYQPGDDIRMIDWRVTARSGKAHTKVFREEREWPVFFLLDQSQSLFFGSQLNFKSVTAAETFALLAWQALHRGDRVGGLLYNDVEHYEYKPRQDKKAVLRLLQQACDMNHALSLKSVNRSEPENTLNHALRQTRRIIKPGSLIVMISDFQALDEHGQRQLALLQRHNELLAIQVHDPMESRLPDAGLYHITDGFRTRQLDTRSQRNRTHFSEAAKARQENLQSTMNRLHIPLISMNTGLSTNQQLLSLLQGVPKRQHHQTKDTP